MVTTHSKKSKQVTPSSRKHIIRYDLTISSPNRRVTALDCQEIEDDNSKPTTIDKIRRLY